MRKPILLIHLIIPIMLISCHSPKKLDVPILLLAGEDELAFPNSKRFHEEAMAKIKHPNKKMIVGSAEHGAGGKNMLPNFSMIRETTLDWLDELFAVSDQNEVAMPEYEHFCP